MRNRHLRTLEAIYSRPTQASIRWAEIETLLTGVQRYYN